MPVCVPNKNLTGKLVTPNAGIFFFSYFSILLFLLLLYFSTMYRFCRTDREIQNDRRIDIGTPYDENETSWNFQTNRRSKTRRAYNYYNDSWLWRAAASPSLYALEQTFRNESDNKTRQTRASALDRWKSSVLLFTRIIISNNETGN